MLVILTNSEDATASHLISILKRAKIAFLRLDTDRCVSNVSISYRLGEPLLQFEGTWYSPAEITDIWYRRPEQLKDLRFDDTPEGKFVRSEWTEFLECFFAHVPKQRWINHPSCNALASRKLEQLTAASNLGLLVPDTLGTQSCDDMRAFFEKHQGKIITKPLSNGYIEREPEKSDTLIYTNRVTEKHLENLSDLKFCPTLFQQFIEKSCDVRITILDGDIHAKALFASDESGSQRCDVRRNNMSDVTYEDIQLPNQIRSKLRKLMSNYGLRFGAIDMAVSISGDWYFFEINPNGQWAWLDLTAGTDIASSFVNVFSQKLKGIALPA